MDEGLDYSQERQGKILGKTISFFAKDKDGIDVLKTRFEGLKKTFNELSSSTEGLDLSKVQQLLLDIASIPAAVGGSYLTGYRRGSVEEEATRKVNAKDAVFNESVEDIEEYERAVLTVSGFAGEEGTMGREQAQKLQSVNKDEKTKILSSDSPFTDVMFKAKDNKFDPVWAVNALANTAKISLKGFNPDAVALVNKVLALREKNPKIKIELLGHSAGGFVAEEAQYLLELLKVEGTSAVTWGTPNLKGNLRAQNITRIVGEKDAIANVNEKAEVIGFKNDDTKYDRDVSGHSFSDYMNSPEAIESVLGEQKSEETALVSLPPKKKRKGSRWSEAKRTTETPIEYPDPMAKRTAGEVSVSWKRSSLESVTPLVPPVILAVQQGLKKAVAASIPDIEGAGKSIGKAVIKGAERALEIRSPSRRFKEIGQQVVAGFRMGLKGFAAPVEEKVQELRKSVKNANVKGIVDEGKQKVKNVGNAVKDEVGIAVDEVNSLLSQKQQELDEFLLGLDGEKKVLLQKLKLVIDDSEIEKIVSLDRQLEDLEFEAKLNFKYDPRRLGELQAQKDSIERELNELLEKVDASPTEAAKTQAKERAGQLSQELVTIFHEIKSASLNAQLPLTNLTDAVTKGVPIKSGIFWVLNQFLDKIEAKIPILGKIRKNIVPLVGLLAGGTILSKVITALKTFNQQFFEVAKNSETINRAIMVVSRNPIEGAKNLEFVSEKAQQLGIDLTTAKQAYSSFIGAAKNTSLEGSQIEQVFDAFAETAAVRGLSQEATDRLFTALSQIIAKRRLSIEEVRSQIGDIAGMGDFMGLIAQSQGTSVPQVEEMLTKGQLGIDTLPKIAAILKSQNALAKSTETAQTLQTRYNNSLYKFKAVLGGIFLPLNKLILQVKTIALDGLIGNLETIVTIFGQLTGVVLIALLKDLKLIPVVINAVTLALKGLIGFVAKVWAARMLIGQFAAAWLLVAVAVKTVTNLIDIAKNQFPEARKDIDNLTKGIEAFKVAVDEATKSEKELVSNLPKDSKDLDLNEGLWGVKWLNLDTLARKPINWVLDRMNVSAPSSAPTSMTQTRSLIDDEGQRDSSAAKGFLDAARLMLSKRLVTQAEKKEADFIVNNSDYQSAANQILMNTYKAKQAAERITDYNAQIAEIQSDRLRLLPGDAEGLKASLEAERKIQELRDKDLKVLTAQQQNLQSVIDSGKRRLDELEQLRLDGGITEDNYTRQKAGTEEILTKAENGLKEVNDIIAKLPKELSEFNRQLKNAGLRVSGFMENRDRISTQERTQIISEGVAEGKGDTVIQLELDAQSRGDISDRISELEKAIGEQEKNLGSAALDAANKRLEVAAKNKGGLTTDVINAMLEEERDTAEKEALSGALKVREWESQLFGYQEQLAQSMQQSRSSLIDFNRTIEDYFFNLMQQIKEAQLEAKTLMSQIFNNKIKNKLKSVLIPGSDSFMNGIIEGIQGLLDQSQALIEKTLGIEGLLTDSKYLTKSC